MTTTFSVNSLYLLSLTLLIYTFFAGSTFSTALKQVFVLSIGKKANRNIYKKRAIQALNLTFVVNTILFAFSAVDLAFFNVFYSLLSIELSFLAQFIPIFTGLSMVFSRLWLHSLKRSSKPIISGGWAFLTILVQLKAFFILCCITFLYFYNSTPLESQIFFAVTETSTYLPLILFANKTLSILYPILTQIKLFALVLLFFFLVGGSLAYTSQLFYTLMSRKIDDFGRDYYIQTLNLLSRNAFRATFFLTIFVLAVVVLTYFEMSLMVYAFNQLSYASLLLPLALINLLFVALSNNALRHKIAIIISPFLILIGSTFFFLQVISIPQV